MSIKHVCSTISETIHTNEIPTEQLHATVRRYCLSITKSGHDAEDLAQDTWLKALPILGTQGHSNPEALLLRIAKTTWIDQTRRKDVTLKLLKNQSMSANGAIVDNSDSLFELEQLFQALLKHMPPLQRTVFILRDVFDYSTSETAQWLRTTEGAVKAALHRARHTLTQVKRELLEDKMGESGNSETATDKNFIQALANAYQMSDIVMLIELMQQEQLVPAVVSSIIGNRLPHARGRSQTAHGVYSYGSSRTGLFMAA